MPRIFGGTFFVDERPEAAIRVAYYEPGPEPGQGSVTYHYRDSPYGLGIQGRAAIEFWAFLAEQAGRPIDRPDPTGGQPERAPDGTAVVRDVVGRLVTPGRGDSVCISMKGQRSFDSTIEASETGDDLYFFGLNTALDWTVAIGDGPGRPVDHRGIGMFSAFLGAKKRARVTLFSATRADSS